MSLRTLPHLDPTHPTTIAVELREDDHSSERTDKRPSENYRIKSISGKGDEVVINFHEGCNPLEGINGVLVEDLVDICIDRMKSHNAGPFACRENSLVITKLEEAAQWLYQRRRNRQLAGTSGTQTV